MQYNFIIASTLTVFSFNIRKIPTNFSKKILQGPPVRIMPRHKLGVIKLLIIATEPILGNLPHLSCQGSNYSFILLTETNSGDGNVDLTPVIEDYKDALFSWWPLTRYQPMERYWKMRSLITTHLPSAFSDWFYIHRHQ